MIKPSLIVNKLIALILQLFILINNPILNLSSHAADFKVQFLYRNSNSLKLELENITPAILINKTKIFTLSGKITNQSKEIVKEISASFQYAPATPYFNNLSASLFHNNIDYNAITDYANLFTNINPGETKRFNLHYSVNGTADKFQKIFFKTAGIHPALLKITATTSRLHSLITLKQKIILPVINPKEIYQPIEKTIIWPLTFPNKLLDAPKNFTVQPRFIDDSLATSFRNQGRLNTTLDLLTDFLDSHPKIRPGFCIGIDPNLLIMTQQMTSNYRVLMNKNNILGSTQIGSGQDAAKLWLKKLKNLAQKTCTLTLPFNQARTEDFMFINRELMSIPHWQKINQLHSKILELDYLPQLFIKSNLESKLNITNIIIPELNWKPNANSIKNYLASLDELFKLKILKPASTNTANKTFTKKISPRISFKINRSSKELTELKYLINQIKNLAQDININKNYFPTPDFINSLINNLWYVATEHNQFYYKYYKNNLEKLLEKIKNSVKILTPSERYLLISNRSPIPLVITSKLPVPITVTINTYSSPGLTINNLGNIIIPATGNIEIKLPTKSISTNNATVDFRLSTPSKLLLGNSIRVHIKINTYRKILATTTSIIGGLLILLFGYRIWTKKTNGS